MKQFYDSETESMMRQVFESFSEKDRRVYAAIEVKKLPYGGLSYISNILNCDIKLIKRGLIDLNRIEELPQDRVRRQGGGRKKKIEEIESIDDAFLRILKDRTAGDPMQVGVIWTDLSPTEIMEHLSREGIDVGESVVKQLLEKHGYSQRKAHKSKSIGQTANRNEQFETIAKLKTQYEAEGNPIVSMDAKKRKNR